MCIFSAHAHVANTQIFARGQGMTQFLAYSMAYQTDTEMAMILPLPTPPDSSEEAVRFIDLSGYPDFFTDLFAGFPVKGAHWGIEEQPKPLVVHEVGSFEASFVPHQHEFARLDARFRLPQTVWEKLPQYADYGFAVFKLKAGTKHVHPMAFEFPRRDVHVTYFPTVHVHDGEITPTGNFDHRLFCQLEQRPQAEWANLLWANKGQTSRWEPEDWLQEINVLEEEAEFGAGWTPEDIADRGRAGREQRPLKIEKTHGLVDAHQPIFTTQMIGPLMNRDTLVIDNR